ncbi:[acyl-carrier-protein] S-malonyltransferase [candidate division NPL-UPA2 bacterium Unc8]|uniref:Malonyl CoA-acyl carrier protein transacylase n=1 Tax=candidate division NPL-UPA2 bacterium Unc8 TaxID=1980939 RepID=A0A399FVZ1_UNCN2|nr:MAG: [acyl-carrier-protein] S-malonyltransferase [candidate division NPL-UPA2 bacterium Unc8]
MAKIGFIFPGQGSQYVGMGKELYESYTQVRQILNKANEVLGTDLSQLCFTGPEEVLKETTNTQLAVLSVSVGCFELLRNEGICPDIVAGHSLGEYTALVAAGSLSFPQALKLVRKRGEFMQEAAAHHPGAMLAIIGAEEKVINEALLQTRTAGTVRIANFNCPGQVVISGETSAIQQVRDLVLKIGAKRAILLPISGAFHSPLMKVAQDKLRQEIIPFTINSPEIPVIANVTADYMSSPETIKELLVEQIASPVLWEDSIKKMAAEGVDTFIEAGPGRVLTGLVRRTIPTAKCLNVEDEATFRKVLASI